MFKIKKFILFLFTRSINIISDRICMQATLLERSEMKTTNMCNIITYRRCTLSKIIEILRLKKKYINIVKIKK